MGRRGSWGVGYPQNAGGLVVLDVIVFHGSGTMKWILKVCAVSSRLIDTQILKNVGSVKSTIAIYGRTQGHNCDTENEPLIGRM